MSDRRMTDGKRFAILVPAGIGMGIALCVVATLFWKVMESARHSINPEFAAFLTIVFVVALIAVSAWAFIKLVNRLYRDTY